MRDDLVAFLIEARRAGQDGRRLRRAGQGQHAAQLLRHPAGPARLHGRPQPLQARPVHARHPDPGAAAGADRRGPARLRAGPAVEPAHELDRAARPTCGSGAAGSSSRSRPSRWSETHEGRSVLRRLRHADARWRVRSAQADAPGRAAPADLARDALLRAFRAQGLRAVPGLRGAPHQGLLPQLRRDREQRLRAARRPRSSCWAATSRTGRSRSSTPGWTRRSASGCGGCASTSRARRCSCANYADVLTDAPLDAMIEQFQARDMVGALLAVPPQSAFHCVEPGRGRRGRRRSARCRRCRCGRTAATWCSARRCSSTSTEDGDLIGDVCAPLAKEGRMMAYRHRGFWQPADTVKERTALEAAYQSGTRPWMLWDAARPGPAAGRDRGAAGRARPLTTVHSRRGLPCAFC